MGSIWILFNAEKQRDKHCQDKLCRQFTCKRTIMLFFKKDVMLDKKIPNHYSLAFESFIKQRGLSILSAGESYFADFPSHWVKNLLDLGENIPVLVCQSVRYINNDNAIMCVETWSHPKRNIFSRRFSM